MKRTYLLFILLGLCFQFSGATAQKKLKVVTTLGYLKYLTEQVGGERVDVTALVNPKQDPHYVTPTPKMNEVAYGADLFIENGLNLDLWAKNVVDASGNPRIQRGSQGYLLASVNIPVKELPSEISRAWGDIHPQGNPHIWLDPLNVKIIAENIANKLRQIDPQNAEYYQQHLAEFKNRIDVAMFGEDLLKAIGPRAGDILSRKTRNNELLEWLKSRKLEGKLGGWMKRSDAISGRKIISYHKTYIYFADRFGLNIVGELEEKPGIPPPPQYRDAVVELIKREGVKAILNDNFYSREAADYVSNKTGAKVVITYLDVGASEGVQTYEHLISYLIEKIAQSVSS